MKNNKKSWNVFFSLFQTIKNYVQIWKDLKELFELESKLASKTVWKILISLFFMGFFAFCTWISLLVLFFLYLNSHLSAILSTTIILSLNLLLLLFTFIYILIIKKNLFFNSTRRQWNRLTKG